MDRNSDPNLDEILAGIEQIHSARVHRSDPPESLIGLIEHRLNTLLSERVEQITAAVKQHITDEVERVFAGAATQPSTGRPSKSHALPGGVTWRITED